MVIRNAGARLPAVPAPRARALSTAPTLPRTHTPTHWSLTPPPPGHMVPHDRPDVGQLLLENWVDAALGGKGGKGQGGRGGAMAAAAAAARAARAAGGGGAPAAA